MAEDLTPKIVQEFDSVQLTLAGSREVTIVRYILGTKYGPFELVFDRSPTSAAKLEAMTKRADELRAHV